MKERKVVLELQERKVWSGVRAGSPLEAAGPADAADVAKGSFGFLDLVFFHGVAWPLEYGVVGIPCRAHMRHSRGEVETRTG